MLKTIFKYLGLLILVIVAIAYILPGRVKVERATVIDAAPDEVFALVNSFEISTSGPHGTRRTRTGSTRSKARTRAWAHAWSGRARNPTSAPAVRKSSKACPTGWCAPSSISATWATPTPFRDRAARRRPHLPRLGFQHRSRPEPREPLFRPDVRTLDRPGLRTGPGETEDAGRTAVRDRDQLRGVRPGRRHRCRHPLVTSVGWVSSPEIARIQSNRSSASTCSCRPPSPQKPVAPSGRQQWRRSPCSPVRAKT